MLRAAGKVKRGCGGVRRRQGPRWQPRMSPVRRDRKKATSGSGSKCYSLISKHQSVSIACPFGREGRISTHRDRTEPARASQAGTTPSRQARYPAWRKLGGSLGKSASPREPHSSRAVNGTDAAATHSILLLSPSAESAALQSFQCMSGINPRRKQWLLTPLRRGLLHGDAAVDDEPARRSSRPRRQRQGTRCLWRYRRVCPCVRARLTLASEPSCPAWPRRRC